MSSADVWLNKRGRRRQKVNVMVDPRFLPLMKRPEFFTDVPESKDNGLLNGEKRQPGEYYYHADRISPFMRNPFIISRYRINYTTWESIQSLFWVHNETSNQWSHLLSAVYFLWLALWSSSSFPGGDAFFFTVFCLGAVTSFSLSVLFHTFGTTPAGVDRWMPIDVAGITILTTGGYLLLDHVLFAEFLALRYIYLSISLLLGFVQIGFTTHQRVRHMPFLKATVIASCVISQMVLPVTHFSFLYGLSQTVFLVWPFFFEFLTLSIGVFAYVSKAPESIFPGRFDIFGASHLFFHIAATVAAYMHFAICARIRAVLMQ
ncbi:putative hemolysin-iii channel protein [Paratrimastix pyriformis]|uniref:Hemolysin-iii channel protein n=1 Tax=Paratrimastix pyriformis TaxID=342808 RepID=A0ABQ8UYP5_9EUKA|nr:putative hemolysin-iii channel protein [Paratrimastix pyriformis]